MNQTVETSEVAVRPEGTVVMACGCVADYLDRDGEPFCSEHLMDDSKSGSAQPATTVATGGV